MLLGDKGDCFREKMAGSHLSKEGFRLRARENAEVGSSVFSRLQSLIRGRGPLIYLVSEEEERVERLLTAVAEKMTPRPFSLYTWSCVQGLTKGSNVIVPSRDPAEGLAAFLKVHHKSILLFKDLHLFIQSNPTLVRQIKECHRALRSSSSKICFVCPQLTVPSELLSLLKVEDIPLPQFDELSKLLLSVIDSLPTAEPLKKSLTTDLRDKIVRAAQGFTANEAIDAFYRAIGSQTRISERTVDLVLEQKEALVRKGGVLEFVTHQAHTWEIGGLFNLKKWLRERGEAFSPSASKQGLTPPKGILVMGVSGCGKSLCIKAIAQYWKLPLLRLDMGKVYDGLAGPPEEAMRTAIKTAEALAPCVLWIDEIEAGIANQQQKQAGGPEARVLALFLTWMQEKTAPVFVGATANEVEVLPPEILRKGRFDELFYMGLPSKEERKEILSIHLRKHNADPAQYDMEYLAESTEGLNGAEIEQGVISALFESSSQQIPLTEHILANALRNIVPLSRTMRERIQKIEAWARDRAMKASLETI